MNKIGQRIMIFKKRTKRLQYKLDIPQLGLTLRLPKEPSITQPGPDPEIGTIAALIDAIGIYGDSLDTVIYMARVVFQNGEDWIPTARAVINREHFIGNWSEIEINESLAYLNNDNTLVQKWFRDDARRPYQFICAHSNGLFVYVLIVEQETDKPTYFQELLDGFKPHIPTYS